MPRKRLADDGSSRAKTDRRLAGAGVLRSNHLGRFQRKPHLLRVDHGRDPEHCQALKAGGIGTRIAKRGVVWVRRAAVMERTIAWLHQFRCLRFCHERRINIREAIPICAA